MLGCFRSIRISTISCKNIGFLYGCFCAFLDLVVFTFSHTAIKQLLFQAVNRVILTKCTDLIFRTIGFSISLKVPKITVSADFYKRRPITTPCTGNSLSNDILYFYSIIILNPHTRNSVADGTIRIVCNGSGFLSCN